MASSKRLMHFKDVADAEATLALRVGVLVTFDPHAHPDTIAETLFSMKRLRGVLKVECPEKERVV